MCTNICPIQGYCRWLRFEESVEEGGDRWSKPRVSSLGLHNVFELRSCILNGVVMLDMVAQDFGQIAGDDPLYTLNLYYHVE